MHHRQIALPSGVWASADIQIIPLRWKGAASGGQGLIPARWRLRAAPWHNYSARRTGFSRAARSATATAV